MNIIVRFFLLEIILASTIFVSCAPRTSLDEALDASGENRLELLKVINHYSNVDNKDSLKLRAALFLIENMPKHGTLWSESIEKFRDKVNASDTLIYMEQINEWWDELSAQNEAVFKEDIKNLKAEFLIQNIDKSFQTWYSSSWRNEIDFDIFCKYILPYRFQTELLADGWRDSLHNEYYPLVKNVTSVKRAFEIIHDTIWNRLLSSSSHFPYTLDVIAMRHQRKATCIQRCIMLGAVMRALGIPAVVDYVKQWANYSTNGHAWTALVTKQGTYTVFEDEFEAKINNRIDATLFEIKYPIDENYTLNTHFKKRYAKIWRTTFERKNYPKEVVLEWPAANSLVSPFSMDVSKDYGLDGRIEIETELPINYAYLCVFATGKDWIPVSYSEVENGKCIFSELGDSVAYLVIGINNGENIAIGNPFILDNGKKICLDPSHNQQQVVLTRKYPLTGKWMNEWAPMVGGRFEGSNDSTFKQTELLYTIDNMPVFRNVASIKTDHTFRYVRYISEKICDTPMAEIEFYNEKKKLKAIPGKSTVKFVELSIDNNTLTRPDIEIGYSLGYDLGKPENLSSIVFFPWNDDNFILPEQEYELFYYDKKWISLGKKKSEGFSLIYENVPDKALLYLKNHTKGYEERPFTYEDEKQVWW